MKVSASQAFRAPSWQETNADSPIRPRPPSLDPEIVRTIEGSVEQAFGTNRILLSIFASDWHDMVSLYTLSESEKEAAYAQGRTTLRSPGIIVQEFRNTDRLVNYGTSLGYEASDVGGRLRYGITATGARAHNTSAPTIIITASRSSPGCTPPAS